jgi:hypothetical protein
MSFAGYALLVAIPLQVPDLNSTLTLDATEVRLSDSVRATFTVEGSGPLRVTVPKPLLADESAGVWKVRSVDPPKVVDLGGGRQRWTLTVRLDPYLHGESLKLAFAPFEVVAGTDPTPRSVAWPGKSVRVWTVAGLTDDVQVTGIEPTPAAAAPAADWTGPVVALSVLTVAGAAVGIVRYRRRRSAPMSPYDRAAGLLTRAETAASPAIPVAEAVRGYVEAVFGIPASRLTTRELQAQLNGMPEPATVELMTLLDRCDAAKFAGSPADVGDLIEHGRRFLTLARSTPT